jgi:hemerythrin-like domain-containing protein
VLRASTYLWPELLRRSPDLEPLLDRMDADHAAIQGPMEHIEAVGAAFSRGEASAEEMDDAITRLEEVLLPHLAAEEGEAMPHANRLLSESDWNSLANKAWRKGPIKDGAFACN